MERDNFERLIPRAIGQIPEALSAYLDNVDLVVEDWPAQGQLAGHVIDEEEFIAFMEQGLVPAAPETGPPGE